MKTYLVWTNSGASFGCIELKHIPMVKDFIRFNDKTFIVRSRKFNLYEKLDEGRNNVELFCEIYSNSLDL
jgi:hypothetical protein